jgi:hypothetical protein
VLVSRLAGAALTYSERIVISLPVYISTLLSDRLLVRRLRYALLGGTPKRDEPHLLLGKALAGSPGPFVTAVLIVSSPAASHVSARAMKRRFP